MLSPSTLVVLGQFLFRLRLCESFGGGTNYDFSIRIISQINPLFQWASLAPGLVATISEPKLSSLHMNEREKS